ncbi:MAG: vWA domain-containing protein [Thermoprotei archaeon]
MGAEVSPAIDEVVPAVKEVLASLPQSVKVSLFLYSSDVVPLARDVSPSTAAEYLDRIQVGQAWTSTFTAVWAAQDADLIIVVTDGTPKDQPREVKLKGKLILIGVGSSYNEGVLRQIADIYNGVLIAARSGQIAQAIKGAVPERIAAKDVTVQLSSPLGGVNLVNFSTNPINLGTLERAVSIYGWVAVPPGYSGEVVTAHVSYVDPRSGERRAVTLRGDVTKASDLNQFLSGVNSDVIAELEWYDRLRQVDSGNAEQTLKLLREVAERTKKLDLIERTKKLEAMKATPRPWRAK